MRWAALLLLLTAGLAGAEPVERPWSLELIYVDPAGAIHGVDRVRLREGERCTAPTGAGLTRGARYGFTLRRDEALGNWTSL